MEGLEKIIAKIKADSETHCRGILDNAAKEAEGIRAEKEKETDTLCRSITEDAKAKCNKIEELSLSKAEQIAKQTMLVAKVNAINEVIADTLTVLDGLECEKYFGVLLTLLRKNIQNGNCVLLLNQKDKGRMPADFEAQAKQIGAENDAVVTLGKEPVAIPNGFILRYGNIDMNCSFPAIVDDMREELKEKANSILF